MTREKKELLKRLQDICENERFELNVGPLSEKAFLSLREDFEKEKRPIYERLNVLMRGRLNDYFGAHVI